MLPLLHGDRFIGRMDSRIDGKTGIDRIHAMHQEEEALGDGQTRAAAAESLIELAQFIAAYRTELGERIPAAWRNVFEEGTPLL